MSYFYIYNKMQMSMSITKLILFPPIMLFSAAIDGLAHLSRPESEELSFLF